MWYIYLFILTCGTKLQFIDNPTAFSVLLCKRTLARVTSAPRGFHIAFYNAFVVCLGGNKNWQMQSLSLISKGNPDFFVNYVRQVVYGFFIWITIYCTSNISLRGVNLCKVFKKFILKNKMIKTCELCDFFKRIAPFVICYSCTV